MQVLFHQWIRRRTFCHGSSRKDFRRWRVRYVPNWDKFGGAAAGVVSRLTKSVGIDSWGSDDSRSLLLP